MIERTWKREIEFAAAWDRRDPAPLKNYGINPVEIVFALTGYRVTETGREMEGAVTFRLMTNWNLPEIEREHRAAGIGPVPSRPIPADLSYHHPAGTREGGLLTHQCPYLDGAECRALSSGLAADTPWESLVTGGSDAVWMELERMYLENFDGGTDDDA